MEESHHPKRRRDWLAIAAFVVAFLTLAATLYGIKTQLDSLTTQLKQQATLASAQYVLDMSANLNSPHYAAIMAAIEDHTHTYSLRKAGFTDDQIEDYMGEFETIGDLYRDNVISFQMAYDEFSYDTEKAYCNVDVQSDIMRDQQEAGASTGTDAFWSGFQGMAIAFLKQDGYTCTSTVLDNQ